MAFPLTDIKVVQVLAPGAIIDNTSPTTNVIDTAGYDYCLLLVNLGATDIAMTALKVQESDTKASATALTSGTDVTGLNFSSDGTLPSATDDNEIHSFLIDCRGRKRYLDVTATMGDGTSGTYATITAVLFGARVKPADATGQGMGARLIG